ncbi:matrin-3 isoform X1 [Amia ocellicauda]|uniref:matrin-3 isoform X1 n=2 Tax=Amia ocellicauda TaxID=2972642 RepID=UPI003463EE4B
MSENLPLGSDQEAFTAGHSAPVVSEASSMEVGEHQAQNVFPETPGPSHSTVPVDVAGKDQDPCPAQSSGDTAEALNLYATLGLSPEDLDALAQIPENKISVETLPHLIMQLKAKRAAGVRPSDPPRQQTSPSPREKPYRSPREDWEDARPSSRPPRSASKSPVSSYMVDYNYGKYGREEHTDRMRGSRDLRYSKPSHKRHFMESRPRSPSTFQIEDFHGLMPRSFPYVCSLCDFEVNSSRAWSQHINGVRHAESRRDLLRMYPQWDPQFVSSRMPESYPPRDALPPGRGSRSSAPPRRPYSTDRSTGERPTLPPEGRPYMKPKPGTRVVVSKFPKGSIEVKDLLELAKPFGSVVKHLVFPCKGFLEMSTHKEAANMVDHYKHRPVFLKDIKLFLYLSPVVESIKTPRLDVPEKHSKSRGFAVVCFSHVPSGKDAESEVIDVAKLFGEVHYSKFSTNEALVEMADPEDAEIMVKYYGSNPLKMNGKSVKVKMWTTHKRLRMSPDSASSRRGETSKRHNSKPKSEETSRSSRSGNKEGTSAQWEATENKEELAGEEEKAGDEQPPDTKETGEMEVESEGDAGGIGVEDEEEKEQQQQQQEEEEEVVEEEEEDNDNNTKEESAQDVVTSVTPGDEPAETPVEAEAEAAEAKSSESLDTALEQNTEEKALENCEAPRDDSEERPAESSHPEETPEVQSQKEELVEGEKQLPGDKEPAEPSVCDEEDMEEMDFPESMEDFVTLDELDEDAEKSNLSDTESGTSSSRHLHKSIKGGRVVTVKDFKRGYGFEKDILQLAKPFGKVTNYMMPYHKNEAQLELPTDEAASEMVDFYRISKMALVCGRPVTVILCQEKQELERPSGRSVYISRLPFQKFSDSSLLNIAQPFGKVTAYSLNWTRKKCFIQMETTESARRMVKAYMQHPPEFYGRLLQVYLCKKSDTRIPWKTPPYETDKKKQKRERTESSKSEEENPSSSQTGAKSKEEGPPVKKPCKPEEQGEAADMSTDASQDLVQSTVSHNEAAAPAGETSEADLGEQMESGDASSDRVNDRVSDEEETPKTRAQPESLGPYQPNVPVGMEYVVPKVGYFCKLCNLFYTNEKTARTTHCSSLPHYQKLKEKMDEGKDDSAQ